MNKTLAQFITTLSTSNISEERKADFLPLIRYINEKTEKNEPLHLNFICTHNSRRSQLSAVGKGDGRISQ